ncbi:hypothetical protein VTL71DRAFT_11871 [Oculimacula yallundae]|uniref:DUF4185 domain-containing protein n=1 Tax=Oculimacula yallundae TaxID=86028 RepID=A0ABR4CR94_9HELO
MTVSDQLRELLQKAKVYPEERVAWPPIIIEGVPMGAHRDTVGDGNWYSRDIGRSTMLSNGDVLFQFGDTFTHDKAGRFMGLVENTVSVSTKPSNPTRSSYKQNNEPGDIVAFIGASPSEVRQHGKIWSFSGIVEVIDPKAANKDLVTGWTWYEMRQKNTSARIPEYVYTGLAKVEYDPVLKRATAERVIIGNHHTLFDVHEPRFGSCSAVSDGQFIYLYGRTSERNKDCHVARVRVGAVAHRLSYAFWNGERWCYDIRQSIPVIRDMQHGQVFKSKMFGKNSPYEWVLIGCNGQGDDRIQMGRAISPEGPWEVEDLGVNTYFRRQHFPRDYTYCVYPHPWADKTQWTGMFTVSWSEGGMTGDVLMQKYRFKMERYPEEPSFFRRKLDDLCLFVRNASPTSRGYTAL